MAEADHSRYSDRVRLDDPARRQEIVFDISLDAEERAVLARTLGLSALRKLRFAGTLAPAGGRDWTLEGRLGATMVQPCGVTLHPVTTRIDEAVSRRYISGLEHKDASGEVEMPEDDSVEPLPRNLSLRAVMAEALALAVPPFPRIEGAELGEATFAQPGAEPLRDEETRPFAGLAEKLKRQE